MQTEINTYAHAFSDVVSDADSAIEMAESAEISV
jgi:hypothetical protein